MNPFTFLDLLPIASKHANLIAAINVMLPELRTLYDQGTPHVEALAALATKHHATIANLEAHIPEIQQMVREIMTALQEK